jgi:hypothetical protein
MAISLDNEAVGRAVEVADGFWILATKHQPGGSHSFPAVNNRCLVFRLVENDEPLLLVINGVEPSAIEEVKRIERGTKLSVRYILSPGGGHHVLLPGWVDAFPEASVLVGPDRIPRTANGMKLMAMPRVSTFDPNDVLKRLLSASRRWPIRRRRSSMRTSTPLSPTRSSACRSVTSCCR